MNRAALIDCFTGLVGWRPSASDCIPTLDAYNTASDSYLYVDAIPGMRLDLVYSIMGKDYSSDETGFNTYLKDAYTSSTQKVIADYIAAQKGRLNGRALLANHELAYSVKGAVRSYVPKQDRFVAIKIKPHEAKNYQTEIMYLGLWFKKAQSILIYLYSTSSIVPLEKFNLNYVNAGSLQLFSLKEKLSYLNRNITQGQSFYLGYYEKDLQLDNEAVDTRTNCFTCAGSPAKKLAPYVNVYPVSFSAGNTYQNKDLPNTENEGRTEQSFGLTASLNVTCDLVPVFCDNKDLFAQALQMQIAIKLFWEGYHSKELGPTAELSKEDCRLMAEKLEIDYNTLLKNITFDFDSISCSCNGGRKNALSIMGL